MGPTLLEKIMVLYHCPTARIRTNGDVSDIVNITNGTQQGCPLSPLLYVLAMEHLTTAIRNNKDIQGIKVRNEEYKMSVFADDLLIYIRNPAVTIPNLIKEFKCFAELSNFKVNYNKSEALNITLPTNTVKLLTNNFSFKWQKNAIKYLGTFIPRELEKLQEYNYLPKMQKITKTLQQYDKGIFSWMGRKDIIKMDILPKILYIFQNIPVFPSTNILNLLRKAIGSFIWAGKPARISREVLTRLKIDGGLALPDLSVYLRSVFVARIVNWFHNTECKQLVKLEEEIAAKKLKSLPWIKRENRDVGKSKGHNVVYIVFLSRGPDILEQKYVKYIWL